MRTTYLLLSVIGFILPNVLVVIESVETGNILLYTDLTATFSAMFANRISTIFATDLLWAVVVFFCWSYVEGRSLGIKHTWITWIATMFFGLAGALPLFLYLREQSKTQ